MPLARLILAQRCCLAPNTVSTQGLHVHPRTSFCTPLRGLHEVRTRCILKWGKFTLSTRAETSHRHQIVLLNLREW